MKRSLSLLIILLLFSLQACGPADIVPVPAVTIIPTSAPAAPPTALPGLTQSVLENSTYDLSSFTGSPTVVTLMNGVYATGNDPAAPGFLQARLGDRFAFGDLNYDGIPDAAAMLAINTGGTGVFDHLVAILDQGGLPLQAAITLIDDRAIINSLEISSGEILMDSHLHGTEDPMCCPTLREGRGYRLYGSQLVLTQKSPWDGGNQRLITVDTPAPLEKINYPFTVTGHVTVGPFENTLRYSIFTADNTLVNSGPVMTDSPDMGAPGNFSLPVDLRMAGVFGLVRVEFAELSMKDGSVISLGSVLMDAQQ